MMTITVMRYIIVVAVVVVVVVTIKSYILQLHLPVWGAVMETKP